MLHTKTVLKDGEFRLVQKLIFDAVGISLDETKKSLVKSRLLKRLRHYEIDEFSKYLRIVQIDSKEKNQMINLITTNETYFFREKSHFDFLENIVKSNKNNDFRIWSAASSIGAEAYTIAMILDSILQNNFWEVVGTDINTEVVKKASNALYPESFIKKIPDKYKNRYCLKGKGKYKGMFLVDTKLTTNVKFYENNLMNLNKKLGQFDIVFLRNVLIYFNKKTRTQVVQNVLENLKIGGYFIISLTERLETSDMESLIRVEPSIYKKVK